MVFLSKILFGWGGRKYPMHRLAFFSREQSAPDRAWKRRKFKFMAQDFYGRKRNCYTLGVAVVKKGLQTATKARKAILQDQHENHQIRVEAGAEELFYDGWMTKEALTRCHIGINTKYVRIIILNGLKLKCPLFIHIT